MEMAAVALVSLGLLTGRNRRREPTVTISESKDYP
jgi:hypothetical protein